jgi:hypothetical protein
MPEEKEIDTLILEIEKTIKKLNQYPESLRKNGLRNI